MPSSKNGSSNKATSSTITCAPALRRQVTESTKDSLSLSPSEKRRVAPGARSCDLEHGRPLVAAACGAPEPPGDARGCGHVAGDDRLRDVVDAVGDHAHRDAAPIEARSTRLRPERRGVPLAGHRPSAPSARPYGH